MPTEQNVDYSSLEMSRAGDLVRLKAAALEAAANGVVITDWSGTVVWVNPAFERLTGYTSARQGRVAVYLYRSRL
jgi:PAS domain-containing protein